MSASGGSNEDLVKAKEMVEALSARLRVDLDSQALADRLELEDQLVL
jgi:hypothetical protein